MDRDVLYREIDAFVALHRAKCLWFVDPEYRPSNDDERRWALTQIQRRCDRDQFVRAAELKRWLSPSSSGASVAS